MHKEAKTSNKLHHASDGTTIKSCYLLELKNGLCRHDNKKKPKK